MIGITKRYEQVQKESSQKGQVDMPLLIATILSEIDGDKLVVPEFQRDFVWDSDKIALLFDSIYRGYTIGNVLLWETNEKLAHKKIGDKNAIPVEQIPNKRYTYILDGQQRLTSIYSVLRKKAVYKGKNKKPKIIRIFFDIKNDEFIKDNAKLKEFGGKRISRIEKEGELDKFRFIDLSQIFDEKLHFPNNLIENERKKLGETCTDINEYKNKNSELEEKRKSLENFVEILKFYRVPQIVNRDENIDRVVTVFERINTQNVTLDIFDIMVAKTYENVIFDEKKCTFNLKRAIDKIKYINELESSQFSPDISLPDDENLYYDVHNTTLLRLISIFYGRKYLGAVALQKSDIYKLKSQVIQDNIKEVRGVLSQMRRYFKNELNINTVSEDFTDNKILSFLAHVFTKKEYVKEDSELLNKWFWNSLVFNRFPGAQLQLIEKDISAYDEGRDYFLDHLKQGRNPKIFNNDMKLDGLEFIDAGYGKRNTLYLASILLLNSLKPKDFNGKDEINLYEYVGSETKENKHHIIPFNSKAAKDLRSKYGAKKADFMLNNIANICIISSYLNKEISGKDPSEYFINYEHTQNFKEILSKHLIDEEMYSDLKNKRYEEFISKRTQKIIELIEQKCKVGEEQLNLAVEEEDEDE